MANNIDIIVNLKNLASKGLDSVKKGINNFGTALDKNRASVSRFNKDASSFQLILKSIYTIAVGKLATSMFKMAGTMEQWEISFETMLGSADKAKTLLSEITEFAIKTPFELPGLVDASKQLLAVGFSSEEIIPTLTNLGNVAAGLGVPIERLILNLGQVKTQSKLTGRELRDFAIAGVPLLSELAKSLGLTEIQVSALVSKGKIGFKEVQQAFENMATGNGRFSDLMIKQSQSLLGKWTNLKIAVQLLTIKMGTVLLPIAKDVVTVFEKMARFFTDLNPTVRKTIVIIGAAIIAITTISAAIGVLSLTVLPGLIATLGTLSVVFNTVFGGIPLLVAGAIALITTLGATMKKVLDDGKDYAKKTKEEIEKLEKQKVDKIEALEERLAESRKKLLEQGGRLTKYFIKKDIKNKEEQLKKEKKDLNELQKVKKTLLEKDVADNKKTGDENTEQTEIQLEKAIDLYKNWKLKTEAIRDLSLQEEIDYLQKIKDSNKFTAEELEKIDEELYKKRKDLRDKLKKLGDTYSKDLKAGLQTTVEEAVNGANGITDTLQKQLTNAFGASTGAFVSGLFGGVISNGIMSIITGIFGSKPVKTVAQYAEESFDRLVKNTNKAIADIGREKTVAEKRVDILQSLTDTVGIQGLIPEKYLKALGLGEQITVQKAIEDLLKSIQGFNDESLKLRQDDVDNATTQMDELIKLQEEYNKYSQKELYGDIGQSIVDSFKKITGVNVSDTSYGGIRRTLEGNIAALTKYTTETQNQIDLDMLDLLNENIDINNQIKDINEEVKEEDLPEYHSGGTVKPINGKKEVKAMMLAGENVFTPRQNDLMISNLNAMNAKLNDLTSNKGGGTSNANTNGNLTIPISLDGNVITKFVVKRYNQARQINTIPKIVGT